MLKKKSRQSLPSDAQKESLYKYSEIFHSPGVSVSLLIKLHIGVSNLGYSEVCAPATIQAVLKECSCVCRSQNWALKMHIVRNQQGII